MRALNNLEPKDVFYFFEEICRIPHGSGNTGMISDYLVQFAKERNLVHFRDEAGNVIIIKEASEGYSDHPAVMLQGHMDMVAVKKPECPIDMEKDGLKLVVDKDRLMAEGTSLGGDDGIAIAYGLALLDGAYAHPKIELVITVDEEVGMDGARALDVSPLTAKRMINLDSEEEGIFLSGCAGGARVNFYLDYEKKLRQGILCEVSINGLKGGHSGEEINKERGNAICLLGRVLAKLSGKLDICICSLWGGVADNAIPVLAKAQILLTGYENGSSRQKVMRGEFSQQECLTLFRHMCEKLDRELKQELDQKDGAVYIQANTIDISESIKEENAIEEQESERIIRFLNVLPHGVLSMSAAMPGLVETSLNPGLLRMDGSEVSIGVSVRSSIDSAKKALIGQLQSMAGLAGAKTDVTGEYPGWMYRKDSLLRDKMLEIYRKMYYEEPTVRAIHAGVECGLFVSKMPDLDCVSIGPNMQNIHTTEEELSISSTQRVWNYLLELLKTL